MNPGLVLLPDHLTHLHLQVYSKDHHIRLSSHQVLSEHGELRLASYPCNDADILGPSVGRFHNVGMGELLYFLA